MNQLRYLDTIYSGATQVVSKAATDNKRNSLRCMTAFKMIANPIMGRSQASNHHCRVSCLSQTTVPMP